MSIVRVLTALVSAAALLVALASPAAASEDWPDQTVLIKVDDRAGAERAAAAQGMEVVRWLPQIGWAEIGARGDARARSLTRSVGALREHPDVEAVDRVLPGEDLGFHFQPRDGAFWSATYNDGTKVAWHYIVPNFLAAWDVTTGASATRVAVIDSEFDTNNADLRDKLVERYNASAGTAEYRTGDVKMKPGNTPHGSHVAGLAGGSTDNGFGTSGAGFDTTIMAIKIGGEASGPFVNASFLGDVAEGIVYAADRGVRVINMSLGGTRPHAPLNDAVQYAYGKGIVIVASAGNSQQSQPGVANYPAAYENVIGVGATRPNDAIASFSTQGSHVDVAAPGADVLSLTDENDPDALQFTGQPAAPMAIKSGTSMAAPIVAGLVALMRTVRPDMTPAEIQGVLETTARDLGAQGRDPVYGAGRIEAAAAVNAAKAFTRPEPPKPPAPPDPPPPPAAVVAPSIAPAPDSAGPRMRRVGALSVGKKKIALRLACPAGEAVCEGAVTLVARRWSGGRASGASRTLGTARFAIAGGKTRTVRVRLGRKARKQLRALGRAEILARIRAADASGNVEVTRTRTVVRPPR